MRENHYAILALSKISQVFTYKISTTLPIFPKCTEGQSSLHLRSYKIYLDYALY